MDKTTRIGRDMPGYRVAVAAMIVLCSAAPAWSQVSPPLGQAQSFAVLGGSTVTNTGATAVIGDLGVSPGTAVTGFPPGLVTGGTIHSNDGVAQQAQADLTFAYDFVAGQAFDADLTGQDLGLLPALVPGVYRFATSAQLTGTLVLDAQGDPDAVFIFQIGSTLTTSSGARVEVINGGSDCNVFWQIGSSATIGTTSQFAGNILALTSITMTTGATVSGRLLARNGAVTLDSNTVTLCAACKPIGLSPATLPNGTLGVAYDQTLTASGGTAPYLFTVIEGSLPPGLSLSSSSGAITGTPTAIGSFTFTVRAVDDAGCFATQIYTIVINGPTCPTIALSPPMLPAAIQGQPYSELVTASGGTAPYTFAITDGALPPGLMLSPSGTSGALISGTPTGSGTASFTLTATDADGCSAALVYTIVINGPTCPTIALAPPLLPAAIQGQPYSELVTASGGTAPYTFAITAGALPPGFILTPSGASSALISGTPAAGGTETFTLTATDADGCAAAILYTIVIDGSTCPTIALAPSVLPAAIQGQPYSERVTASGGTAPYTFAISAGALPPGLTLAPSGTSTVLISGTPTGSGPASFTLTATDVDGCAAAIVYAIGIAGGGTPVPALSAWAWLLLAGLLALAVRATSRSAGRA
ncbi:MAG TPA: ice-binding family protein [Dokdonella sp.]|uniref:ice-binding family protein n=1 Tax=Dokdonella sp. TaxID=2291710 RepID=UPI002C9D5EFC|nr:ice-binding family protein [Dokdonella sp.]HUD42355.1 ice-binding family protein [Dokdonella sp.]